MQRQRLQESCEKKDKRQRKPAGACVALCCVLWQLRAWLVHACAGMFLCVHLPATDSRLRYMSELVPGTTSPGKSTALPQQPGAAVYFSLAATQNEYHEILLKIWATTCVCTHSRRGGKPPSCAPWPHASSSLKAALFMATNTFQNMGGVSEFGREHASPLSQQQISSLWWAARLFHKSGRGCPFRGYLCCIGQLANLAGFNLHDLAM